MLKSTIPFANIRFFDDTPTVADLERRFSRYLRNLREQREIALRIDANTEDESGETLELFASSLSSEDTIRIANRAANYVDRLEAATCMQHLASGAVPVLARIVRNVMMIALGARRHTPTECFGSADLNGGHHFELVETDMTRIVPSPRGAVLAKEVRYLQCALHCRQCMHERGHANAFVRSGPSHAQTGW